MNCTNSSFSTPNPPTPLESIFLLTDRAALHPFGNSKPSGFHAMLHRGIHFGVEIAFQVPNGCSAALVHHSLGRHRDIYFRGILLLLLLPSLFILASLEALPDAVDFTVEIFGRGGAARPCGRCRIIPHSI